MRRLSGVVAFLMSCTAAQAQTTIPPLERRVETSIEVAFPLNECSVPKVVSTLAQRLHFPTGIEYLPGTCPRPAGGKTDTIELRTLSLREALDKLVELDRRYRWVDSDGVIVVRPLQAWGDPKNVLNFESASFTLEDTNLDAAAEAIVSAIYDREPRYAPAQAARTTQGSRVFSLKTGPTSVGGALDAIVRAHGDAWWELRDFAAGGPGFRILYLLTFDGAAVRIVPIRGVAR